MRRSTRASAQSDIVVHIIIIIISIIIIIIIIDQHHLSSLSSLDSQVKQRIWPRGRFFVSRHCADIFVPIFEGLEGGSANQ